MDVAQLQASLSTHFAPWVQDLQLSVVEASAEGVVLRLPRSDRIERIGGLVCGQALMAISDTGMALALCRHFGAFRAMSTVQLNSQFLKPLVAQDGLAHTRLLRVGKSLAFGEIEIRGARDQSMVCTATTTYALL